MEDLKHLSMKTKKSLKAVHPKEADHLTKEEEEEEETSQDSDDDCWGQWGGEELKNKLKAQRAYKRKMKDVLTPRPPGMPQMMDPDVLSPKPLGMPPMMPPMCNDPSHQQCGGKATPKKATPKNATPRILYKVPLGWTEKKRPSSRPALGGPAKGAVQNNGHDRRSQVHEQAEAKCAEHRCNQKPKTEGKSLGEGKYQHLI